MTFRRLLSAVLLLVSAVPAFAQLTRQTTISTLAGTGTPGYLSAQDGALATAAQLNLPSGVVQDIAGNLFIADTANHRIRKIDGRTGQISTVAGSGTAGYRAADEGVIATFAQLNAPQDIAVDTQGNLFIADTANHRIRRVSGKTGLIVTVAGTGATRYGYSQGDIATTINISQPTGLAIDSSGNLYVADAANHVVLQVTTSQYDEAFVSNPGAYVRISTFAGNGISGYTTTAGEENVGPRAAHLTNPNAVTIDQYGFLYIADTGSNRIRKVTYNSQNQKYGISTVAGNGSPYAPSSEGAIGTATGIGPVTSVKLDIPGNLYLSAPAANRLLKLSVLTNKIATYAGNGTAAFTDGIVPAFSQLNAPAGIAVNGAGTVFIADSANNRIRAIPVNTGNLLFPSTVVGSTDNSRTLNFTADSDLTLTSFSILTPMNAVPEFTLGTPSGCAMGSALAAGTTCSIPIAFKPGTAGRRMVAIQVVTSIGTKRFGLSGVGAGPFVLYSPTTPILFAGAASGSYTPAEDGGPATAGHFAQPVQIAFDAADNLFVTDLYGRNIRKIDTSGIITTVAGGGSVAYTAAAENTPAKSVSLGGTTVVTTDATGNLFFADSFNQRIFKVDAITGKISTYAGNGTAAPTVEGAPAAGNPIINAGSIFLDQQGNLFLGDLNHTNGGSGVRRIDAATGVLNSITNSYEGILAVDDNGTVYVAGTALMRLNTMTGQGGNLGGVVYPNPFANSVQAVSFSANGDLLLASAQSLLQYSFATNAVSVVATNPYSFSALDSQGNAVFINSQQIFKLNLQNAQLAFAGSTVVGQSSSDSPMTFSLTNTGSLPFNLPPPASGLNPSVTSDFQFTSSSSCPRISATSSTGTLAPAAACSYGVNFIPVAPGSVRGKAVFTDNQFGTLTSVTQTVNFTGTASGTAVTTSLGLTGLANAGAGTPQTVTVTAYSGPDQTHVAANYTGTVTFTTSDTNSGVVPAPYTFTTADAGVHTFTITLKMSDRQSVDVTDKSNSALTASQTATVSAGRAVNLKLVSGTPQSVDTNSQFASALFTQVLDTYGNGVPNVSVTYSFPASGASASVSVPTVQTDSTGFARVTPTANAVKGSYTVTATAAGSSVLFQITNNQAVYGFNLTASSAAIPYGPDILLLAKITPASVNSKYPTGTVTFYEGATVLASGPIPGGGSTPQYLVPAPSVGSHTYTASYSGDTVYPAFAQSTTSAPVVVSKGDSSVDVPFTPTVQRPGSFNLGVGNAHGADSSTKAFLPPSGAVTYTISAVCGNGGALSGSLPLTNGAATFNVPVSCPAGSYQITYGYAGDSNYNAATLQRQSSLTVTAPSATISITNLDQNYDGQPKPVTVITTPAGLTYQIGYLNSPGNGPPTLAGMYPVRVTITDPNYTGSASATLTVRRGPAQIYWPLLDPIAYGTALSTQQLSATTTDPGSFAFNPIAGTSLTPGTYTLSVTFTPTDSPTTPTTAIQTILVTKGALGVRASDAGRFYADPNSAFTGTVSGAVNGDTFTVSGSSAANASSPANTYPIVPSVNGTNLAYYVVSLINGTLTVSGAPATISLSNLNQTYDSNPKSVTVTTVPVGLNNTVTYNGSATAPTQPGTYSVVATITDPNYTGTANGVLNISAGATTVTWNTPAPIVYGTPLSTTQLNATASVPGKFVYIPSAGAVLQPGSQTITVFFTPTSSGLLPSTSAVVLVVNKAPLTVTAANATRRFGIANPSLTATVAGVVNGDVLSPQATSSATAASPIGTYTIVPSVSGSNVNAYNVTYINGTLTVTPGLTMVTLASNKPTTFVSDTVTFTATVSGPTSTPTGSVEFFNGAASLGVKPLQLDGSASVQTSSFAAGIYTITAVYSGDTLYAPNTSGVIVETIFTSDYTIVVNPTVLIIHRGQSGSAVFTVTPTGNFHDTITFACATLPVNATCTFAPTSLTPNGGPVSTTLTIATTAGKFARMEQLDQHTPWQRSGSGIALATLFGTLIGFRRRFRGNVGRNESRLPNLFLLLLLNLTAIAGMTGCGSTAATTPNGTYTVGVTAGVAGSAGHTVSLTVNIVD